MSSLGRRRWSSKASYPPARGPTAASSCSPSVIIPCWVATSRADATRKYIVVATNLIIKTSFSTDGDPKCI